MLTFKKEMNIDDWIYRIGTKFMEFPINLLADWSKALGYATSRKWVQDPGASPRFSYFFKFYFKDFNHFDDARVFCLTGGLGGYF